MKKIVTLLTAVILVLSIQSQDISNTVGTNGNFKVNNSSGTTVLTVTDDGQTVLSDIGTTTPAANTVLDLNSTTKVLQLPIVPVSVYGTMTKSPGQLFWAPEDGGRLLTFFGTGGADLAAVLDARSPIRQLFDVNGNITGTSYYIGTLAGNEADELDNQNVAFGKESLYLLNSSDNSGSEAEDNTAVGYQAGYHVITGRGNTAIGALSGVVASGGDTIKYSTAIGYNAKATDSYQIMLGTADEKVIIPGDAHVFGSATIDDVLNLEPRTQPATAEEGDVYYDATNGKLRFFNGTIWLYLSTQE
jgi:hypothetical protein